MKDYNSVLTSEDDLTGQCLLRNTCMYIYSSNNIYLYKYTQLLTHIKKIYDDNLVYLRSLDF